MTTTLTPWQAVLDFWFLPEADPAYLTPRDAWFKVDPAFDDRIRDRFEALVRTAIDGGLRDWEDSAEGALARILLLDQFTRNIWRGTPDAFSGDAQALAAAQRALDAQHDQSVVPVQRAFFYLPFEHAEDTAMQARSVELFTALAASHAPSALQLDYAIRHRDVIDRYGRFPHRNAILGRANTADEVAYLAQPGAGF